MSELPVRTHAKDFINPNETAVVFFTRGLHFSFDPNGNGQIGNWVIAIDTVEEIADKVIVYVKDDQNGKNRIFVGNYSGVKPSPEKGRYIISFSKLKEVGVTESNWFEFGNGSQDPVCYVG